MHSSSDFDRLWMPFSWWGDLKESRPPVVTRGEGIYVWDSSGRKLIDAVGSWWVSSFGHCHPDIVSALREQVSKLDHILMAGFVGEPALRLSAHLGDLLPRELTRIFFSDDGSTSVEVALKIALQYNHLRGNSRSEFIGLGDAYHGDTFGAMSVSSMPVFHSLFHERFKKQHAVAAPFCYRCPAGKEPGSCSAECMDSLERLLEERHEKIAACIFEPMVQGAVGMHVYPAKVLKRIFELCRRYHVLTIADEVATGFGRTGKLFACEHAGAVPDIMCMAKGLTGGFLPMGLTAVQEHIFEEFKGEFGSGRILYHGHSFTGNPLAAAAACATMELLKKHDIPNSLGGSIAHFRQGLESFREYPAVGDIRTIGMIGAIELVKNRQTKEPFEASTRFVHKVALAAMNHGVLMRPLGDVIYFIPAFIITPAQMDEMFSGVHHAIREVLNGFPAF